MDDQASYIAKFKCFGYNGFTAKHCYFRCSRPTDVHGIKSFDIDDPPKITMLSSEVIMTKLLTYQKYVGGLGCPFDFVSFSRMPF